MTSPIAADAQTTHRRLLDAAQAAELLGVPKTWVLAEARANRIPHIRLGRYVRFETDELEAWCQTQRRGFTHRPRPTV